MSVALHVMSPESRGLFHRAISQSGTAFSNSFVTSRKRAEQELQKALIKLGRLLFYLTEFTLSLVSTFTVGFES